MAHHQPTGSEAKLATHEFVAFLIAGQEFAIDIMSVREIRGWTPTTPLPEAPDYLKGVVNLRGAVLPIVDLAIRLGFPTTQPTSRHAVIVAQINELTLGLLVEGVSEIMTIDDALVQPTPVVGATKMAQALQGLMPADGRMVGLLSLKGILQDVEPGRAA